VCEPFSVVVAFWPKRAGLLRIDWRVDGTMAFPIRQAARSLRALALDCDMGTNWGFDARRGLEVGVDQFQFTASALQQQQCNEEAKIAPSTPSH
jgi:hypothetical protein